MTVPESRLVGSGLPAPVRGPAAAVKDAGELSPEEPGRSDGLDPERDRARGLSEAERELLGFAAGRSLVLVPPAGAAWAPGGCGG